MLFGNADQIIVATARDQLDLLITKTAKSGSITRPISLVGFHGNAAMSTRMTVL